MRTTSPGFLRSLNRMNVMLTRCQAGMVLVTQRAFLRGSGQKTLLGVLAKHWQARVGESIAWVDAMEIANGTTKLPRVPAKSESAKVDTSIRCDVGAAATQS